MQTAPMQPAQPTRPFYLSITLWYNVIMFLMEWTASEQFTAILPASWVPYLAMLQAGGTIFIRIFITKAAISFRKTTT
jgi:hypothetical protein